MPRDTKGKAQKPDDAIGMVHMERAKKKGEEPYDGSKYPYGLRVHVDHEGLKKLDMDELSQVGHAVELRAKAQVMGVRSEQREDGTHERHLEMQITHLGVHHKPDGMKSEDQGGSERTPTAGKVTAKKGSTTGDDASYTRKRH